MTSLILAVTNDTPARKLEPHIQLVSTTPAHIRALGETIRRDDKREIESYGFTCAKGIWRSYKQSLMNRCALVDGKVAAVWGVAGTFLGDTGQPFLLTSYESEKISPLRFAKIYQFQVYEMLKLFPSLVNFVLADYSKAVRLLQIVGFTLGEPEMLGQGLYRKFSMKRA